MCAVESLPPFIFSLWSGRMLLLLCIGTIIMWMWKMKRMEKEIYRKITSWKPSTGLDWRTTFVILNYINIWGDFVGCKHKKVSWWYFLLLFLTVSAMANATRRIFKFPSKLSFFSVFASFLNFCTHTSFFYCWNGLYPLLSGLQVGGIYILVSWKGMEKFYFKI